MKNVLTTIELNDTHVKMLQTKITAVNKTVVSAEVRPLVSRTDEELFNILRDFALNRLVERDKLILVVPRRFVILRQMELPSKNVDELRKMIELQLVNQIPYNVEDVVFDFNIIENMPSGYTRTIVAVVPQETVYKYLRMFEEFGVALSQITFDALGVLGWWQEAGTKTKENDDVVLVINIDSQNADFCFCWKKQLLFARSSTLNQPQLSEDVRVELLRQVELSLGVYKKFNLGPEIKKIKIVSFDENAELLKQLIIEKVFVSVELIASNTYFAASKKLKDGILSGKQGVSFISDIGLHWFFPQRMLNLTPKEIRDRKSLQEQRTDLTKSIVLLFLLVLIGAAVVMGQTFLRHRQVDMVKKYINSIRPLIEEKNQKQELIAAVNEELTRNIFMPEVLLEIQKLIPEDVSLRSLSIDQNQLLSLQGYAQSNAGVNTLQNNLVHSERFKEVNLVFSTKRRIYNLDLTDFKITAKVMPRNP